MIAPKPLNRPAELARATRKMLANEYGLAEAILQRLARQHGCPTTWRLLALTQLKRGDLDVALVNARRSIVGDAGDALGWNTLGMVLDARGDVHRASDAFRKACDLCPDNIKLRANWGKTLIDHQQFHQAVDVLTHTLALGEHGASRKRLAYALTAIGRLDAAARHYRHHLARNPSDGDAWFALASLGETYFHAKDVARLQAQHANSTTSEDDRIGIEFALSRHAEHAGDYDLAYRLLASANASERNRLDWNSTAYSSFVVNVLSCFRALPPLVPSSRGLGIVFIVGLPRTGSSLVEQTLAQHPNVAAAGEVAILPAIIQAESQRCRKPFPAWVEEAGDADWERLGLAYLQAIGPRAGSASVVTDKRPGNWIYLGAILRMLPAARIIHTHRAAVDACFGCFRQRFSEGAQAFSYDLAECVDYWRDCEHAMRQWQDLYPAHIRSQSHETFVAHNAAKPRRCSSFADCRRYRRR